MSMEQVRQFVIAATGLLGDKVIAMPYQGERPTVPFAGIDEVSVSRDGFPWTRDIPGDPSRLSVHWNEGAVYNVTIYGDTSPDLAKAIQFRAVSPVANDAVSPLPDIIIRNVDGRYLDTLERRRNVELHFYGEESRAVPMDRVQEFIVSLGYETAGDERHDAAVRVGDEPKRGG